MPAVSLGFLRRTSTRATSTAQAKTRAATAARPREPKALECGAAAPLSHVRETLNHPARGAQHPGARERAGAFPRPATELAQTAPGGLQPSLCGRKRRSGAALQGLRLARAGRHVAIALLLLGARSGAHAAPAAATPVPIPALPKKIDFETHVLPIFKRNCLACHNAADTKCD